MSRVLFLSLIDFNSINERNIYTDLLREFIKYGHKVCIISPVERRKNGRTYVIEKDGCKILKLRIGNIQKTNIIEKGISTLAIEPEFIAGIKKYFSDTKFDLVLYATPPITFCRVIEFVKKRDKAKSYLLLKDIFPQNAVDIGLMSKKGLKAPLYKFFRSKEKNLYRISDRIGCMSTANVEYVLRHNPEVKKRNAEAIWKWGKGIVEECPNCIEPIDMSLSSEEKISIREKYNIPTDKIVFVYGGNLGKPQGIEFLLKCLHSQQKNDKVFFLIVGSGMEYERIEKYIEKYRPINIRLRQWLPKDEYDKVVAACDVGMIFLDHRFTIPNFPSRLLSYMQAKLPVLAVTDPNTDFGNVVTGIDKKGRKIHEPFGWWCESNRVSAFEVLVEKIEKNNTSQYGFTGYSFLLENYKSKDAYSIIMEIINN